MLHLHETSLHDTHEVPRRGRARRRLCGRFERLGIGFPRVTLHRILLLFGKYPGSRVPIQADDSTTNVGVLQAGPRRAVQLQPGGILAVFEGIEAAMTATRTAGAGAATTRRRCGWNSPAAASRARCPTRLMSEDGIAYARRKFTGGFAERARTHGAEGKERRARLARIEQRIIANPFLCGTAGQLTRALSALTADPFTARVTRFPHERPGTDSPGTLPDGCRRQPRFLRAGDSRSAQATAARAA